MALKALLENLDNVPEALKSEYTQTDAGFVLNVDGADYQQKIGEFRGNNINLKKEKEELAAQVARFKDIDPAKYLEMKTKLDGLDDKSLIESGKIDELVEKRAQKFADEFTGKIESLETGKTEAEKRAETYKARLDSLAVNDEIAKAVSATCNAKKGALEYILSEAKKTWKVNENGVPIAMDGDKKLYGKDGKELLSSAEWVQSLAQKSPFLFEGNIGGGAAGSGGAGGGTSGKSVQTITQAQYESGKFIDEVADGRAVVAD